MDLNRREVIQLAAVAAVGAVTPQWANADFRGEVTLSEGIQVVRPWILKDPEWIDDPIHMKYGPLQIFRSNASYTETRVTPKSAEYQRKLMLDVMQDHLDKIAAHIIMSSEFDGMVTPEGAGPGEDVPVRCLRGFRSRYGRMPLPGDEGRLVAMKGRYLKVMRWYDQWWDSERIAIITECTFRMDRLT